MKSKFLFLLSLQVVMNSITYDLDIMSQVISDLIQELFIKNQIHFDILAYGNVTRNSLELIDLIGAKNDGQFADKTQIIQPDVWDHKIYKSAVIFVFNEQSVN